ncbi:MAG TPA: TetR/AcrR family transcriptional regulator [Candidatus Acidoferrum sp.]|nr:TetR/AcrR family transcriptional regulator [Candidatus Acidoferrum sp.]
MPRTLNLEQHTVRRDAFLDVAQRLIQTKGYAEMSIQDVLDALETSRGAFYHYFDSKQALLEAVVDRFADVAMAGVAPILVDPNLPALRKLEKILRGIARFKAEQKDLMIALIDVMNADSNTLFREKLRRMTAGLLTPIIASVIRQGIEEGIITTGPPDEVARVIVYLVQGFQQLATEQFLARQAGTIGFDEVARTYMAFTEAFERILGVTKGSVTLVDQATLHFWFG